jgi:dTDP-4-amino-4,6-dideoxygalactose transaminase
VDVPREARGGRISTPKFKSIRRRGLRQLERRSTAAPSQRAMGRSGRRPAPHGTLSFLRELSDSAAFGAARLLPHQLAMTPIRPFFLDLSEDEIALFQRESARIFRSGNLILGEFTSEFERAFAEFVGVKHAIACNSGSTALEILMRLEDVAGRTVLVPTNTNFATAAAVLRAGGKVRYLDMDRRTFAPTLEMVEQHVPGDASVAGLLWVHIGGVVSPEFPAVVAHCRKHGVFVHEDAAHAHGSALGGIRAGALADAAAFSFFPTKVMTTFEGGMITTNDDQHDYLARSFRNQGKRGVSFGGLHHDFGNSSRITEPGALLGIIQLKKLDAMLARRQAAYAVIAAALDRAGIEYVSTRHMSAASQYKMIVLLPDGREREAVKKELSGDGVIPGGGVYEIPCHRQPVFEGVGDGECPAADEWCPRHICPPLTSGMADGDAERVAEALVKRLAA